MVWDGAFVVEEFAQDVPALFALVDFRAQEQVACNFYRVLQQVSSTRFRIPDVCAVPSEKPFTGILTEAPVLCVEVLSPEDRFQRVVTRAQEYQQMGVPNIWIIDPKSREAWVMDAAGGVVPMMEDAFTIPGTLVRVVIADVFDEIDSAPKA